jgi:hypothetical protein
MHNGVGPMMKTKAALVDKGATALNWFIHTPMCVRASIHPHMTYIFVCDGYCTAS